MHDHLLCSAPQIRRREWKDWCAEATGKGARRARSFLRGGMAPEVILGTGPPEEALERNSLATRT
eukprot:9116955-Pyramimonas_sp.AAC.1